ncbi:LemA family protein, partial [Vibrio anguillarum]
MKTVHLLLVILIASTLIGCGYNDIQRQDESVKAAWSEVINQYQRRADLVPNLVNTLKGYIQHEERVFVEVTNARAKVGSIQVNTDSLKDPQTLQTFQSVQG